MIVGSRKISAIISPSGNFYGSERVLYDFLKGCKGNYDVYVPHKGEFIQNLNTLGRHTYIPFNRSRLKLFYIKVSIKLLAGFYKNVYVNEGGHIRYIRILAKMFPKVRFYVHIRIIDDTAKERLGNNLAQNIKLITISHFLKNKLPKGFSVVTVYDPYSFSKHETKSRGINPFKIGVVGRVDTSKASDKVLDIISSGYLDKTQFHFFGAVGNGDKAQKIYKKLESFSPETVVLHGYVNNTEQIYGNMDVLLHLNENEGLGRVCLEALDYNIPCIGMNSGGIAEINRMIGLEDLLCEQSEVHSLTEAVTKKVLHLRENYEIYVNKIKVRKPELLTTFNDQNAIKKIEQIITNEYYK